MFLIIGIVLLILWGAGFAFHLAGALIHILLVIAIISIIANFIMGRRV